MARHERRSWGGSSDDAARRGGREWAGGIPSGTSGEARYVRDQVYGGSTKDMARAYGVTPRTVQRWIQGTRGGNAPARTRLGRETREALPPARVKAKGWIGPTPATRGGRVRGTPTTRLRTMPAIDLDGDQTEALAAAYASDDPAAVRAVLEDAYGGYFAASPNAAGPADVGEIEWLEVE